MLQLRSNDRKERLKFSKCGHVPISLGDDPLDPSRKIIVNLVIGPDRTKKSAVTGIYLIILL